VKGGTFHEAGFGSDAQVGVPVLHKEPCAGYSISSKARCLFCKAPMRAVKLLRV
jgi:hypothetical protein